MPKINISNPKRLVKKTAEEGANQEQSKSYEWHLPFQVSLFWNDLWDDVGECSKCKDLHLNMAVMCVLEL